MKALDFIEQERNFYDNQTIEIPGNEEYSQSELIFSINCARLSKYIDDNATDDIIGQYPYDNVSKYRIRLEARATDFDPKHIEVEPKDASRESRISAMIATKALHRYMRKHDIGALLDDYADSRPEYGGFLAKKNKDGTHKVPWENVITDMSDILGGVIIERHYMLPSQLKKTNWKNVDEVIREAATKRQQLDMKEGGIGAETITKTVEVWELHGEVQRDIFEEALAAYEGRDYDEDEAHRDEYVMCQIICAPLGKSEDGSMKGQVLFANEEAELPYKYDARNPMAGRGLGEGIPEELKEHQRWHNFYKTEEARAVAIGGKVLFITDSDGVADTIFDDGIEHGTILRKATGTMFEQLNTLPTSVPLYQNIRAEWDASGDKVTSSFNATLGEEAKSGTPYKAQYLQDINANSQFLQYREHMGRFIRGLVEDWWLEEALNEAAKDDELFETFSRQELQLIDEVIVAEAQLEYMKDNLLTQKRPVSPQELEAVKIGTELQLQKAGSKRSIEAIKKFISRDVIGNVIIHTTDEDRSKAVLFESYNTLLQSIQPGTPEHAAIIDRIMDMLGISREVLALYAQNTQPTQTPEIDGQQLAPGETPVKPQ
jgi:hypothetical protein